MTVTQLIAELTELGPEYKDFPVIFDFNDNADYEPVPCDIVGVATTATEVILG